MAKIIVSSTHFQAGTVRAKTSLNACTMKNGRWVASPKKFPELLHAAELFRAHGNFGELVDKKNPGFLKGFLTKKGEVRGARIGVLPDGEKIDKAYSLFADSLTFHGESSHSHWDVLYKNPGGTWAYCYSLAKKSRSVKKKFGLVEEFEKRREKLESNLLTGIKKGEYMAVPLYILLHTY
ncbi:MAG: hypothetical protein NUV67_03825, partial [archaeon]|nr:hypothetical protein [archaeon]